MTWDDLTIPTLSVGSLLAAIVLLVFRAIVRGALIPKATMDARVADFTTRLAEQKATFEGRLADKDSIIAAQRVTIAEQDQQLDELLVPLADTVHRVLTSLPGGQST